MSRIRIAAAVAGAVLVVVVGASAETAEKPGDLKQMMGENFAGLQTILYALISANYAAVPDQVEVISQHATALTQMVPANAKARRTQFLTYAMNLGAHAEDLKQISRALMEHDAQRATPGPDYLREALAAHYGGMVSMCVACHNQFRPLPKR